MWVVVYKSVLKQDTWHKTFSSRESAKEWMDEYIEHDGTDCLLCKATEGFGSFLFDDDHDLPLGMMSDQRFRAEMEKMSEYYQSNNRCRKITHLSEITQKNTVSQGQ